MVPRRDIIRLWRRRAGGKIDHGGPQRLDLVSLRQNYVGYLYHRDQRQYFPFTLTNCRRFNVILKVLVPIVIFRFFPRLCVLFLPPLLLTYLSWSYFVVLLLGNLGYYSTHGLFYCCIYLPWLS